MAISNSIERFSRFQKSPVVMRNGQYDADAITSPAVVYYDHTYFMIYTGWSNILEPGGFLGLTGAVSTDGIHWIKHKTPIFTEVNNTDFETATEADIVFGPDKMFYLIFSAEGGIALARSAHPFGPWDIYPSYIITSEYQWESGEVVAPEMIIENEKAKIWYTGVVGSFAGSSIGYVEINFPFEWP